MAEQNPSESIVNSDAHYLRVRAGPGTGKSYSMKKRISRLLEEGVSPWEILVVTFTRATAFDLRAEITGMEVLGAAELQPMTLHALALRLFSSARVREKFPRSLRLISDFERDVLIADMRVNGRNKTDIQKMLKAYEALWARLQDQQPRPAITATEIKFEEDLESWLKFHQAMLVGEVIPKLYRHLEDYPMLLEKSRYRHVLVDEFQDLNKAEQSLIDMLAGDSHIIIVGDEDQSIYGFKYAHPEGIRSWREGYPERIDQILNDCRRCPTAVVMAVNRLISYTPRKDRTLLKPWPSNGAGEIHVWEFWMPVHEARQIVREVEHLVFEKHVSPSEVLILVRNKTYGEEIERQLSKSKLTYRSYLPEATTINDTVRHRLQVFSLLVDNDDRVALRWLLGEGSPTWYKGLYAKVRETCVKNPLKTSWEVLDDQADGREQYSVDKRLINRFRKIRREINNLREMEDAKAIIDDVFPEHEHEIATLREIALSAMEDQPSSHWVDVLAHVHSVIRRYAAMPEEEDAGDVVRLMTLHKSKGLSAPFVFVLGCVNGILPSSSSDDPEEERRLMYVGASRVKASQKEGRLGVLVLTRVQRVQSHIAKRLQVGIDDPKKSGLAQVVVSPFIKEMGLTITHKFYPNDSSITLINGVVDDVGI